MAVTVGFEPTLRYKRKHAFQACALSHSATSPLMGGTLARKLLKCKSAFIHCGKNLKMPL